MPESDSLREGLGTIVDLGKDAAYCDIAERFVDVAGGYLADAQSQIKMSPVKWGRVSLKSSSFLR